MAEPHSSTVGVGLVAAAVAFFGPLAGEYLIIVAFGFAGALFALDTREGLGVWRSAWLVARGTTLAVAASSFVARQLELRAGVSAHESLALVALVLAARGDAIMAMGIGALQARLGGGKTPSPPAPPTPPQGGA